MSEQPAAAAPVARIPSARRLLKALAMAVGLMLVAPLLLLAWLEKSCSRSEEVFTGCAQLLALVPGLPGVLLRGAYYFGTLARCSWEVRLGFGSHLTHRGARLGARVSTGSFCVIGHAEIGDDVMMASRVSIPSGKRQHLDEQGRLSSSAARFDTVRIGSHSWVGEGAIIMADVGAWSIVSAGAVVVTEMPQRALIGGNPAKVIRSMDAPGGS